MKTPASNSRVQTLSADLSCPRIGMSGARFTSGQRLGSSIAHLNGAEQLIGRIMRNSSSRSSISFENEKLLYEQRNADIAEAPATLRSSSRSRKRGRKGACAHKGRVHPGQRRREHARRCVRRRRRESEAVIKEPKDQFDDRASRSAGRRCRRARTPRCGAWGKQPGIMAITWNAH